MTVHESPPLLGNPAFDRDAWVQDTLERISVLVNQAADSFSVADVIPPSPSEVEERVADLVLPTADENPMVALLAPFWSSRRLQAGLGASRQAMDSRMKAGTLLGLKTGEGALVFPVFQFVREPSGQLRVRPGVVAMLQEARRSTGWQPWSFAVLLRTPAPELEGLTPCEWMRDAGRDQSALPKLAARWAREWSS